MITYCTNIHPGETWGEIFSNLQTHCLDVKKAVSPKRPFPIGLRLSNKAASQIDETTSISFLEWCREHDCFVPTINGFPYGVFNSGRVKESVYLPDWRHRDRVEYTKRLVTLLDSWLPGNVTGSVSTVPVGFKGQGVEQEAGLIRKNLLELLELTHRLKERSGKDIILSLEPEPGCILETTSDVIAFFEKMKFPEHLRQHIGICYDCCHQAVEFEDPGTSLRLLSESGIRIGKVQVSSAPRLEKPDKESLKIFCDPVYLHQVVIRKNDGSLLRFNDLPDAMKFEGLDNGEWRIHFHLPVFIDRTEEFETTRFFIDEILRYVDRKTIFEIETYTWDVLPAELRTETVADSIVREIKYVESKIYEQDRSS